MTARRSTTSIAGAGRAARARCRTEPAYRARVGRGAAGAAEAPVAFPLLARQARKGQLDDPWWEMRLLHAKQWPARSSN
ncbi:hypothetical protein GCM10018781_60910 [Kitasatospora indigofera]|uniref:Uncharacterized protein n=1 Tax=Kitasatospora indigofera TaxID=67307 RepID=A0A919G9L8_9ACTN|nr:hypothetical protein GCM10018781_60910 [Kitasatospora indigofera]